MTIDTETILTINCSVDSKYIGYTVGIVNKRQQIKQLLQDNSLESKGIKKRIDFSVVLHFSIVI